MSTEPRYEHDCDACVFIESHALGDIWVCPGSVLGPTVIIRRGDEPWDYWSMPGDVLQTVAEPRSERVRLALAVLSQYQGSA